jgi:hypothetical protein
MMTGSTTTAAAKGSMKKKQSPVLARTCPLRSRCTRACAKVM